MARTEQGVDFVVFAARRERDVTAERAAIRYVSERLGGRARIGGPCEPGRRGKVFMLASFPLDAYRYLPRWQWAAAALAAGDEAAFRDEAAMYALAKRTGDDPDIQVMCLTEGHFRDCWNGNCFLPIGEDVSFPSPHDAPGDAPAQVVGA